MDSHYIIHIMITYNIFIPLILFFFAFKQRIDFNFFILLLDFRGFYLLYKKALFNFATKF